MSADNDCEQRSEAVRHVRFPGRFWLALAGFLLVVPLAASAASGAPSQSSTTAATTVRDFKPLPGQSVTQLPSGQWLLVGGRQEGSALAKIALYDPAKKQTTTIDTPLDTARSQHTATLMADGTVLILGGRDNAGDVIQSAESFDPSSQRLQTIALPAILARAEHRATVLADGRLLITGGVDVKGNALCDAEVLNPFSNEVEVINLKTETARFSHLVALLPAHTVQLWGGIGSDQKPIKSAEFFDPETLQFKPYATAAATQALAALTNDEAPRLIDSEPADAATHVGVGQVLAVRFSKQMDVTTLNTRTVTLLGVTGLVTARVTPVEGGLVLFVWPTEQLRPASDYSLMIKGAKDTRNQSLDFTAIAFKTDAIGSGSASGTGTTSLAGSLAGANQGSGAGLAINGRTSTDVATRQTTATTPSDGDWIPEIVHYKGSWTSGRVFNHSRDYARGQAVRQGFLDSLIPVAKAKIRQHWLDQNLLPETGSMGAASTVLKPAASVLKTGPGALGSLSGQILRLDGQPLAGVTLKIAGQTARSDASGEFLLQNAPLGNQVLEIDGRSASGGDSTYGRFDYHIDVQAGLNDLNFTIWMPRLDTAHAVRIPSPTINEVVVTNPNLPGLELRIPPGTIIRDVDGKIVNEVSITPIPLDQTPFPMPYREVPMFFTIQPGGATLQSVNAQASPGAKLIYPNYTHQPAGARLQLFDYDPKGRGWYIYTQGTISADGNSIKPDQPFVIYQFTATSAASSGGNAPPEGPQPCEGSTCCNDTDGDPVACHEGLFLESKVDLALADILPLNLSRTYRQNDANQRAFGIGASHDLDMYLSFVNQSSYTADAIDVVHANGGRERFVAPSGSKDYQTAVFQSKQPGSFYKAELRTSNGSWGGEFIVTRKDGMRYGFSYYVSRLKWIEDRDHNRISLFRDTSGRIDTAASPNGRWIAFEYTATNCANCVTHAYDNAGRSVSYEYNTLGELTKVTDAEGGITTYAYDSAYRMTTVKDPVGQTTGKFKVTNVYDTNGRVQKQTYADGSTDLFAYTLDTNGKVIQTDITHERGDIRRITYNANGFMLTDTRALGKTEQQAVTYTRNADDVRTDVKDALGRVTHYDYDTAGNLTKLTKLYGTAYAVAWSYTYDPVFNLDLASVTDPLSHTTKYSYDSGRHLIHVEDALGNTTDLSYTALGQLQSITRYPGIAAPLTSTFSYDGGDLVGITDPLNRTTRFQTDAVGRTVSVIDPLGHLTRRDYDGFGRVTAVTDALGHVVSNTYDGNGNLLAFTDARGNVTQWTYDSRNRPLNKKDALQKTEYYAYDAGGNLLFVTDRKGQVSGFQYDALGRRTSAGYGATSTSSPVYQSTTAYTWDAANRLTQIVDSLAGTISRFYDDRFDALAAETSPEGLVEYSYLDNGLRESMTPSDGTTVGYTWDFANRLIGISQEGVGSGDALPRVAQNVDISYDGANRRSLLKLPNGIKLLYTWDAADQLTNLTYQTGTVYSSPYHIIIGPGGTIVPPPSPPASTLTILGNLSYGYDEAGQRISQGGTLASTDLPASTTATAVYDADNRLTSWNGTSYSYDTNGNLINDGTRTYTWNSRNQLVAIAGPTSASFAYDGLGRRRSRTVGGVTTQYLYDGQNAIQEKNGTTVIANLFGGLGLDEWYGRTEGNASLVYVPDALGSTIALSDENAALTTRYSYDPYGATTATGTASTNALAYAGRENDGTGLYYNRARYYHPGSGRFISEDPIGLAGGANLYAYALGNPMRYTDPFGLDVTVCFFPNAANGFGHEGVGPDADSTEGFYPAPGNNGVERLSGPGAVLPDSVEEKGADKVCTTHKTTAEQDKKISDFISERRSNPGKYHFFTRNCSNFVSDALTAGNVPTTRTGIPAVGRKF